MGTYIIGLESQANLDLARTTNEFIPRILSGQVIEVGLEPHTAHEYIVAHIIRDSIASAFGLLSTQVALDRDL